MRVITLQDLRQHVLDLWGKADGITWLEDRSWMATALHETSELRLHPIVSEAAYATALHEIGHIRLGRPLEDEDMLVVERKAWSWARDNALIWTPTMENEAKHSLGSYEADGEEQKKEYYYRQIEGCVTDLLSGSNPDGLLVCDALVRNAAELVDLYECVPGESCTEGGARAVRCSGLLINTFPPPRRSRAAALPTKRATACVATAGLASL
jgi:hypothetical protein